MRHSSQETPRRLIDSTPIELLALQAILPAYFESCLRVPDGIVCIYATTLEPLPMELVGAVLLSALEVML